MNKKELEALKALLAADPKNTALQSLVTEAEQGTKTKTQTYKGYLLYYHSDLGGGVEKAIREATISVTPKTIIVSTGGYRGEERKKRPDWDFWLEEFLKGEEDLCGYYISKRIAVQKSLEARERRIVEQREAMAKEEVRHTQTKATLEAWLEANKEG